MRHRSSIKVNEDDVPPSKHTLFFRNLDVHISRDDIKRYFDDEIGPCNIEFYRLKHNSAVCAVRFDERSDAKRCFDVFENKKVLNCDVEISWYKDVRGFAEKLERDLRESRKRYFDRRSSSGRHKRHTSSRHRRSRHKSNSRSRTRSISKGISISSDEDGPKRKHRRRHSSSSGHRHSRSRSSYSSSSSGSSRHSTKKRRGPHTPDQTPPPDFESSYIGPEFIKYDCLGLERSVGLITLNRQNSQNSLCAAMISELADQLSKYESDREIKAVVITGDKENFACDFEPDHFASFDASQFHEEELTKNWKKIAEFTKPLLAAVNGNALGIGFELALLCDIVYGGLESQFGHPAVTNCLIPGFGATQFLTRAVGKSLSMEMCLTGKKISADEALKYGLISKIFPSDQLLDETIKLADVIAKNPPLVNVLTKKSVNYAYESLLSGGLIFERQTFVSLLAAKNANKEGSLPPTQNVLEQNGV